MTRSAARRLSDGNRLARPLTFWTTGAEGQERGPCMHGAYSQPFPVFNVTSGGV